MVQGGYNAVLAEPDSLDAHLLDTLKGGGWINDQDLAWTLVTEAPGRVHELEDRYGCFFDRHPDGRIHQKPFAGQTHDRTIHKGDLTGIEIMNRLTEQVWRRASIRALEEHRAIELLRDDAGRVGGAILLDIRTRRRRRREEPGHAPGDGRRADHVPGHRVLGRQGLRRHRARHARRPARARHGDGPVPSDRAHRARTR